MAFAATSTLSLSAAGIYVIVLAACLAAAFAAARFRQAPAHWRTWAFIALGFSLLAFLRVIGAEEIIRDSFRQLLAVEGVYENRRSFQRPLAAGILGTMSAAVALGLLRQWYLARGRRNVAVVVGLAGLATMVMLLGLRIVSLHQLDMLLYGPLKLNWIMDLGASLAVLGAALLYIRFVTQRP